MDVNAGFDKIMNKLYNVPVSPDPEYDAAKQLFQTLSFKVESITKSLSSLQNQITKIMNVAKKTTTDLDLLARIDEHTTSTLDNTPIENYLYALSDATTNYLTPRLDKYVIKLRTEYLAQIAAIKKIDDERDTASRKLYQSKKKLEAAQKKNKDLPNRTAKYHEKENKFKTLSSSFVAAVNELNQNKADRIELPYKNLVLLFYHYLQQLTAVTGGNPLPVARRDSTPHATIPTEIDPYEGFNQNPIYPPIISSDAPATANTTSKTPEKPPQSYDPPSYTDSSFDQPAQTTSTHHSGGFDQPDPQTTGWAQPAVQENFFDQPDPNANSAFNNHNDFNNFNSNNNNSDGFGNSYNNNNNNNNHTDGFGNSYNNNHTDGFGNNTNNDYTSYDNPYADQNNSNTNAAPAHKPPETRESNPWIAPQPFQSQSSDIPSGSPFYF